MGLRMDLYGPRNHHYVFCVASIGPYAEIRILSQRQGTEAKLGERRVRFALALSRINYYVRRSTVDNALDASVGGPSSSSPVQAHVFGSTEEDPLPIIPCKGPVPLRLSTQSSTYTLPSLQAYSLPCLDETCLESGCKMRSPAPNTKSKRTCDRCYEIKARCYYDPASADCHRCDRLGHACEVKRPTKTNGRPRKQGGPSRQPSRRSDLAHHRISNPSLLTILRRSAGFQLSEVHLLEFFLHPDQMGRYIYGRTFLSLAQSAVAQQFFMDPENLKEGALALAEVFMFANQPTTPRASSGNATHVERASRALQTLRTIQPTCLHSARTAVTLALLLLWYNDFTLGQQSLPISRYALLLACKWQEDITGVSAVESDANIISLLFAEMSECLVRREIPVFRYKPPVQAHKIDRHYGICDGLLPHLYDICEFAHHQKHSLLPEADVALRAREIVGAIESWSPRAEIYQRMAYVLPMADFERQHLISQGYIFQLMALLLMQSLHPTNEPGSRRQTATQLRQSILEEVQRGAHGPRYLLFPYFISCLELGSECMSGYPDVQVVRDMQEITNGLAPSSCKSMFQFLEFAWECHIATPDVSWFELVDKWPGLCIGP